MSTIDKTKAQAILKDIQGAMGAIAAKHGLIVQKTGLKYGEMVDVKIGFAVQGGKSKEQLTYERYRRSLSLPPLGHTFLYRGSECTVEGMRVGGPYKNIIFKKDGKLYKANVYNMLSALGVHDPLGRF